MTPIIEKFYDAFQKKDFTTMSSCYHEDIVFQDPAFGELKGQDAKDMWEMLCKNGTDLKMTYRDAIGDETDGEAYWEAIYTFGPSGKKVHNKIKAKFTFKEDKILTHHDDFDLHVWAKQALGWKGKLLGGTTFFRKKLQQQTRSMLRKFQANK